MLPPSRLGCPLSLKTPNMGNPGLTLMGFGPSDPPSAVPNEGELEVEVDEWVVIFMWGTTGTPLENATPVMRQIEPPPAEVADVYTRLTSETLTQLPGRIRSQIAGDSSVAYNHHDYDCVLIVNRPWKSGSNVRSYAYWNCTAEARTNRTRLSFTLWRNFDLIDSSGGSWQSVNRQSRSVSGPCASGLNAYHARANASVEFNNGQTRSQSWDRTALITCS